MAPDSLDDGTADRLLAGHVAPEDAPPGYASLARVLQGVSRSLADASVGPPALEPADAFIGEMAAALRGPSDDGARPSRRNSMLSKILTAKVAVASAALALGSTAAAAATGSLPAAPQATIAHAASLIGVSLPDPREHVRLVTASPGAAGTSTGTAGESADPKAPCPAHGGATTTTAGPTTTTAAAGPATTEAEHQDNGRHCGTVRSADKDSTTSTTVAGGPTTTEAEDKTTSGKDDSHESATAEKHENDDNQHGDHPDDPSSTTTPPTTSPSGPTTSPSSPTTTASAPSDDHGDHGAGGAGAPGNGGSGNGGSGNGGSGNGGAGSGGGGNGGGASGSHGHGGD
jgi:uncharacterized membrane protein YgcG